MKIQIGSKIRIKKDNDNETYAKWRDKVWTVEKISYSTKDHPGYDNGVGGPLVDCKDLPVSLYNWEFDIVG